LANGVGLLREGAQVASKTTCDEHYVTGASTPLTPAGRATWPASPQVMARLRNVVSAAPSVPLSPAVSAPICTAARRSNLASSSAARTRRPPLACAQGYLDVPKTARGIVGSEVPQYPPRQPPAPDPAAAPQGEVGGAAPRPAPGGVGRCVTLLCDIEV
jgi:hypothetical protein